MFRLFDSERVVDERALVAIPVHVDLVGAAFDFDRNEVKDR